MFTRPDERVAQTHLINGVRSRASGELEDFRRPNSLQATWECVAEPLTSGEQS